MSWDVKVEVINSYSCLSLCLCTYVYMSICVDVLCIFLPPDSMSKLDYKIPF